MGGYSNTHNSTLMETATEESVPRVAQNRSGLIISSNWNRRSDSTDKGLEISKKLPSVNSSLLVTNLNEVSSSIKNATGYVLPKTFSITKKIDVQQK